MNKAVAEQAWAYCSQQQNKEFGLWTNTGDAKQAEAHRLACASWADLGNWIYRTWLKPEPQPTAAQERLEHVATKE